MGTENRRKECPVIVVVAGDTIGNGPR